MVKETYGSRWFTLRPHLLTNLDFLSFSGRRFWKVLGDSERCLGLLRAICRVLGGFWGGHGMVQDRLGAILEGILRQGSF